MTTGAQEVTTVDELQLRFVGGGGVVGSYAERGCPITTGALEVTTLQLRFDGRGGGGGGEGGGGGGGGEGGARGPLIFRCRTL